MLERLPLILMMTETLLKGHMCGAVRWKCSSGTTREGLETGDSWRFTFKAKNWRCVTANSTCLRWMHFFFRYCNHYGMKYLNSIRTVYRLTWKDIVFFISLCTIWISSKGLFSNLSHYEGILKLFIRHLCQVTFNQVLGDLSNGQLCQNTLSPHCKVHQLQIKELPHWFTVTPKKRI